MKNMFKDYDKYLLTSLKVYLFVLVIIFILKIVGLDYFGIDVNNPAVIKINLFMNKYNLTDIWYGFTLLLYSYIMISIVSNNNGKKTFVISIIITIIDILCIFTIKYKMNRISIALFDFLLLYCACLISNNFKIKCVTYRMFICFIINMIFQYISLITRNEGLYVNQNDFVTYFILNFDYILLMIIYHRLYFMKGDVKICGMVEVGSYLLKKLNLKNLLINLQRKLQSNLEKFELKDKTEKVSIVIYFILSLFWNVTCVVLVLLVAKVNGTFVECIFILSSFWLSKRSFGKPFHLNSMLQCFLVSNFSYYILNRITASLGISIFVPILLGVGLSYVSSKFVKKTNCNSLYRGMSEDLFNETILKVVDKDSLKYKICYEFYIEKKSDLSLSFKYNYSVSGIRKIKDRINQKIKRLN